MDYPGKVIKEGASETDSLPIRTALLAWGIQVTPTGAFDAGLTSAIKLFQTRYSDLGGRPLTVDGEVGPLTWAVLFSRIGMAKSSWTLADVLAVAGTQIGVREDPFKSNTGPQVDKYLASVGLDPGYSWCMSFVHWCFDQVTGPANNPLPKSGGVLDVFDQTLKRSPSRVITQAAALANFGLLKPGHVFIMDHGGGHGHTGFVISCDTGGALVTIEGNTNPGTGTRDGDGVYQMTRRSVSNKEMTAFLDFSP